MKEPRVDVWCDGCFEEVGEKHPGVTTAPIAMPNLRHRMTLDLCERHTKELISEFATVLRERGSVVIDSASKPKAMPVGTRVRTSAERTAVAERMRAKWADKKLSERWDCELCGKNLARNSAAAHVYAMHNPRNVAPYVQPSKCPTCREELPAPSMTMHRIRQHNWNALDQALTRVGYAKQVEMAQAAKKLATSGKVK